MRRPGNGVSLSGDQIRPQLPPRKKAVIFFLAFHRQRPYNETIKGRMTDGTVEKHYHNSPQKDSGF